MNARDPIASSAPSPRIGRRLMLLELRIDLQERADPTPEWLSYIRSASIDLSVCYPSCGILAVAAVSFLPGRYFEFDDDGIPSAVIDVIGDDAETVIDLCAWPLRNPGKFATAL